VLKVTPAKASASVASTRIKGKAELWHRRFDHLSFENLTRVVGMVDGIPASVADAKRVIVTVCVPCVNGKMARAPHHRSTTTITKCELVHTDVAGALTESLVCSVYLMMRMKDSTGFITATPIKTKGMVPDVIKARITQLETLTGLNIKRVRHDGAKEYVSHDLKAWYDNKGSKSEKTAPYSSQQSSKAERVNCDIMERVRAARLDAGAGEELRAEALSSGIHVLNRSRKAGQDVTPLEALTERRPDVKAFRTYGRAGSGLSIPSSSSAIWSQGPMLAALLATLLVEMHTASWRIMQTRSSSAETYSWRRFQARPSTGCLFLGQGPVLA